LEARHCLNIVIEHIGPTLENEIECICLAATVGNKHFHTRPGIAITNHAHRFRHCPGAFIWKIVSRNGRYDSKF
jgi:hypothetical protein